MAHFLKKHSLWAIIRGLPKGQKGPLKAFNCSLLKAIFGLISTGLRSCAHLRSSIVQKNYLSHWDWTRASSDVKFLRGGHID